MRRASFSVAILAAFFAVVSTAVAALGPDVNRAIEAAQIRSAKVAVSIRDSQTNSQLVEINANEQMIPASNMKLITTGAALHALGPNFQFRTQLLRDRDRLIVLGDGDPGFGDPELLELMEINGKRGIDVDAVLDLWVQPAIKLGLTGVKELVVDDRIFDREFLHSDWPADQLNRRYCAQIAGLNFHVNVLNFFPEPRAGSQPDVSRFTPMAPWLELVNRATCRNGPHDGNDMWIARQTGGNQLTFYGNCKVAYRAPVPVTVNDMPDFFGRLLSDRLVKAGLKVGASRSVRADEARSTGESVGPAICTPISTAVTRCNRDSQNLYAESLLKRMGAARTRQPGSWSNGAAILRLIIHERLVDPALSINLVIADGSGLSRNNRIAASTMTAWLNTFHADDRIGPTFINSMGSPGGPGPLEDRFNGMDLGTATVRAKTGYINEVCCLSGFVTMPDGRRRSFSILVNGLSEPGAVARAKKMQEQIVAAIAQDMSAVTATQMGSD